MWSPNYEDGTSAIVYSPIQEDLVGCQTFDLCIYASLGMSELCRNCSSTLSSQREIVDLARPRELVSVPLETWSKLVTRIKEQRNCKFMGQRWIKIIYWIIFIGSAFYLGMILTPLTVESVIYGGDLGIDYFLYLIIVWIGNFFLLVSFCLVYNHLEQKHLEEIFLPSVRGVLSEVKTPLAASGYEAELVDTATSRHQSPTNPSIFSSFQPEIWLLRFTLLPNDEERRVAKTINTATTTLPFVVPLATANPALLHVERASM